MDYHNKSDGLTASAVADAHDQDLGVQDRHGVRYLKYWFDEDNDEIVEVREGA